MKQSARKKKIKPHVPSVSQFHHRVREGLLILSIAAALFMLAAFVTYHPADMRSMEGVANAGGRVGHWLAYGFFQGFGYLAYLFPLMIAYSGWIGFRGRQSEQPIDRHFLLVRSLGFIMMLLASSGLASLCVAPKTVPLLLGAGGIIGTLAGYSLVSIFNFSGSILIMLALLLCGITLFTGLSWMRLLDLSGRFVLFCIAVSRHYYGVFHQWLAVRQAAKAAKLAAKRDNPLPKVNIKKSTIKITPRIEPRVQPQIEPSSRAVKERQVPLFSDLPVSDGELPPLSLLDPPEKPTGAGYSHATLEAMSREVEARLHDFGIEVQVVAVHPGPVITRFEMQLAAGVKVSRITSLVKDLARSLSVTSVRIVEVIAGKSVVGLELPNEVREIVRLSEVLASQHYEQSRSPLSLALGKDIAGHPVIVDLAKMPHLLVAGTTGSGKSVGLNAMILSLLYKATPHDVRMIMIDPKMLELSIYEGIPHLLAPVVTDMKEAANALRWCVSEMDRRYRLMAALGVRNLAGYNTKLKEAEKKGTPILDPFWQPVPGDTQQAPALSTLPYVVVLVDEFADMMMVVGKKVEELIARIAQKARAAGIHMILATQRPSVDVITGLIKANVPTRIAFQVSSRIDSRTILDQQGAEQLLGHGDMLYLAPGSGIPVRVHGAFVDDHEVHRVVDDWRKRGAPEYVPAILESQGGGDGQEEGGEASESDPLYDQAVQIVIESRRASISHVQRRLKIGYNRAARMIEDMEKAGIVSSMESTGAREVLVQNSEAL